MMRQETNKMPKRAAVAAEIEEANWKMFCLDHGIQTDGNVEQNETCWHHFT